MGKYSKVKKNYPAFQEEQPYQQLINEAKLEILGTLDGEGANINRLASIFASYDEKKKALFEKYGSKDKTDAEYEINVFKKALSQMLVEEMESQGMNNVNLSSGALVYIEDTPIPVVKNKAEAITKLLDEMPEILTISFKGLNKKQFRSLMKWGEQQSLSAEIGIHDQTLKATVRSCTIDGRPLPPGTEVFFLTQARLKNGSSSEE